MNYQKVKLNKKKTGKRIQTAITSSMYSFTDVARALELTSERTVYYWINGKKIPSLENIINLSLMFNIKVEDLIAVD